MAEKTRAVAKPKAKPEKAAPPAPRQAIVRPHGFALIGPFDETAEPDPVQAAMDAAVAEHAADVAKANAEAAGVVDEARLAAFRESVLEEARKVAEKAIAAALAEKDYTAPKSWQSSSETAPDETPAEEDDDGA